MRGSAVEEKLLGEAVRRLVTALHPERIFLFGSRARGDDRGDSDYDLLVVVPNDAAAASRNLERSAREALKGLHISSDIVIQSAAAFRRHRPVGASLAATVEREGRLLYGEPDQSEEAVSQMELDECRDELVRDWLERAEQDLMTAERAAVPPPLVNAVAFHAQQAAEKVLKAVLAWHNRPLQRTHDLESLVSECAQLTPALASLERAARTLTPYAIAGRYPDDRATLTERDAEEALRLAREIVQLVIDQLPDLARPPR